MRSPDTADSTPHRTPEDGRIARGIDRRKSIIAATLRVIEGHGVAGVSHRTVAAQADVRPSLVAYYFSTLDDLLVAALTCASEEYDLQYASLLERGSAPLVAIATIIADAGGSGRGRALAEREMILMAARRPALRSLTTKWPDLVGRAAAIHTSDPVAIEALVAITDGICAQVLLSDENDPISPDEILAHLHRTLGLPAAVS
ncbi:TetR/AcrR family transcriptional regulator [Cryobacterium psychrophilum]|uniref:TetR family transcriptional regulator n=1 Tax=Cryobacterium psychrophilum TaxID=41988 RepID=A0A4Y8KPW1_9MICO|nr:TetR family transcriptional regulator [Cryobacterium psychrophilum]TDW30954.1 TetR family transcriptional regulator [Cryobacterium psychrophilum]TFD80820.1 TetR family transcriptional regulator [Cryobacterium psychrophilum]